MIAALRGTDPAARLEALGALEAGAVPFSTEICEALIELLADARKEISRRAAGALGLAALHPDYRRLLERTLGDPHPGRRWCAAFALARAGIADEKVFDAALEAMGSNDGDVRWAAAEIVCSVARAGAREAPERADASPYLPRLRTAVRSPTAELRKMALYCLRDLGGEGAETFVAALGDPDRGVRLAGLAGLGRTACITNDAVEKMLKAVVEDPDAGVRRAAAATLARRPEADSALRERLARVGAAFEDPDVARATGGTASRVERGKP